MVSLLENMGIALNCQDYWRLCGRIKYYFLCAERCAGDAILDTVFDQLCVIRLYLLFRIATDIDIKITHYLFVMLLYIMYRPQHVKIINVCHVKRTSYKWHYDYASVQK